MAEPVKETPRGVELSAELLNTLARIEDAVKARGGDIQGIPTTEPERTAFIAYYTSVFSLNAIISLYTGLEKLSTRGFFDDNKMELATEVLKGLGER